MGSNRWLLVLDREEREGLVAACRSRARAVVLLILLHHELPDRLLLAETSTWNKA